MLSKIRNFLSKDSMGNQKVFFGTLILLALILGIIVRYEYISGTVYPINDGGLFYRMTADLLNNGLVIPQYTTYNNDLIPFAYPPFTFYVLAGLKILTNIPLLKLIRFTPFVISILTLPAYYLLVKRIFTDRFNSALALIFFALIPRAFEWFLMGGGITRAFGLLFSILALEKIWQFFSGNKRWTVIAGIIIFSSFTVLSHPETALFVIFGAIMFFCYHGPTWEKVWSSLFIALCVIAISAPWIIAVISQHGLGPFLGAGNTGHKSWFEIKNLVTLNFGFENVYFLTVSGVFALVALFSRDDKLTYYLFGMMIMGYIFFPRIGPNILTIFVSMLAALGLRELLNKSGRKKEKEVEIYQFMAKDRKPQLILLFILLYMFMGAFTYKYISSKNELRLTDDILETFSWVQENTMPDDGILIYPSSQSYRYWWNDFVAEWFPALTDRHSLSTVQGYEWIPEKFNQKIDSYFQLHSCFETGPECVEIWEQNNQSVVDYLMIDEFKRRPDLVQSFMSDVKYQMVYKGDALIIFRRNE